MRSDFTPRLQYTLAAVGIVGGVASLGYSIYKDVKAGQQDKAAAAEGANLRRPFEKIPDEYFKDQNLAEIQASVGLPIDTQNFLQTKRDQQLGTSFDAIKESGLGINEYGRLTKLFDESVQSEGSLMAQQHQQNIDYLINVNKDIAGQKITAWGVNEYQPFESKLKEIQDRRAAEQVNKDNAAQQAIGSLQAIGTSVYNAYGTGSDKSTRGETIDDTF